MDIVISHMAALQVIRQPYFTRRLASAELCPTDIPDRLPSASELSEARATFGQLDGIEGELGLLVSDKRGAHACDGVRPHVLSSRLPAGSLVQVAPGVRCASPLLLPLLMAPKLSEEEMLMLLSELMGLFSVANGARKGLVQRDRPMASPEAFGYFLSAMGKPMWSAKLERLVGMAPARAASPPEAQLYLRASGKFARGGYGISSASLNDPIELAELGGDAPTARIRKPDLLVSATGKGAAAGVRGACLDYMGAEWHSSALAIKNDALRRNELLAAGYVPFEIFSEQFDSIDYMDDLMANVRDVAGLPRRRMTRARAASERAAREELWARLRAVDMQAWTSRDDLR